MYSILMVYLDPYANITGLLQITGDLAENCPGGAYLQRSHDGQTQK